jgi:hypothetical protein
MAMIREQKKECGQQAIFRARLTNLERMDRTQACMNLQTRRTTIELTYLF